MDMYATRQNKEKVSRRIDRYDNEKKRIENNKSSLCSHLYKKKIANVTSENIQRVFFAAFGLGSGVQLSIDDNNKLGQVVTIINNMPDVGNTNIAIFITVRNSTDSNPANTTANAGVIRIDIQHWVIRKNSVDFIAAMIAHEIGVHNLADAEIGILGHTGGTHSVLGGSIVIGQHTYVTHPAAGRHGAQQDHIDAAMINQNLNLWSPRAKAYLHTMVRMGNEIATAGNGQLSPNKISRLHELLETYLFDIARIIVEDDQAGLSIILHTFNLSEVMNWIYNLINNVTLPIQNQPVNHWINRVAFSTNGFSLIKMLSSRFLGYLSAVIETKIKGHL